MIYFRGKHNQLTKQLFLIVSFVVWFCSKQGISVKKLYAETFFRDDVDVASV